MMNEENKRKYVIDNNRSKYVKMREGVRWELVNLRKRVQNWLSKKIGVR